MNKKAERGRATREHLLEVATGLFAEHGYEDTSIEAVLQETAVSRGALYHHFGGKEVLFTAVLESLERDVTEQLIGVVERLTDPVETLRAGCLAWVRLAADPVVQRILLIDAPSVIGWERWRALEEKYALGMTKEALRLVADAGRLPAEFVDAFAHMLLAALNEMALMIARSEDSDAAIREGVAAVEELLHRLVGPGPASGAGGR
ncbi:TetR/AcrR family transcriptional regulator [Actinoallomurus purpureus]|uniref:TetR/AcrR family transcriptional regulator n=1 Tax=Actinoallomurus purpureus TaxID=478114 RepID=UPI002092EDC5|nr:TetR/AcrR family transcriptional regulator [Actinoallomurus purpureus]MCO6010309.1 TetR/AcrR family transcriptional regulator [Actinoallomurus purpureus]